MCEARQEEFKFPFQIVDKVINQQIENIKMLGYQPNNIVMERSCFEHYCNNKLSWVFKDSIDAQSIRIADLSFKTWNGIKITVVNNIRQMNNFGDYGLPIQVTSKLAEETSDSSTSRIEDTQNRIHQ